jgi:hypothetical protein
MQRTSEGPAVDLLFAICDSARRAGLFAIRAEGPRYLLFVIGLKGRYGHGVDENRFRIH